MGRKRRVGGPGWAGVFGSMVGLGRTVTGKKGGPRGELRDKGPPKNWGQAQRLGWSRKKWQKHTDGLVQQVEQELLEARRLVERLEAERRTSEKLRQDAYSNTRTTS